MKKTKDALKIMHDRYFKAEFVLDIEDPK